MIEYAKMVGIMISVMTAAWLVLQPAVDSHIVQVVEGMELASKAQVERLTKDVESNRSNQQQQVQNIDQQIKIIDNNQDQTIVNIKRLDTQIDNIEKLAKESRELQLKLLFELRGRDTGPPRE